ncbi:unnamed protein product [Rotaria socialis]|uniref:Glycosyl hydrolase family 38 C-terminal domain-containing protein n=2 Tax=Rotaria socialis TaxID=392032 RepID=A0A820PCT2_9BILA|nr:unnamed protein product [Rotaria socialis]
MCGTSHGRPPNISVTSTEIRIYDGSRITEIEWIVGPIPIEDNLGKEIIVRYDTDIQSDATFYSDSNGREVLEHKRDYRPSWNYIVYENVSGNYYPIPSRIWIKDNQRQLTIPTGKMSELLELTLGDNLPLSEMKRLVWTTNNNESSYWQPTDSNFFTSTVVTLNPMEIKNFQVALQ